MSPSICPGELQPYQIINKGGVQNEEQVLWLPARIEIVTGYQQRQPAPTKRGQKINSDKNWKKY